MRKIKIAVIGANKWSHATGIMLTLKFLSEQFEIVGYTLPENEREKFPELMSFYEGYPELTLDEILNTPEIEAVAVETEEIYLTKYATLAALHGKHIHMEKPGGIDLEAFENMIDAVKKGGKVFHTGYMYRYNPYVQEIIARVQADELGDIISVEAQMNCYHEKPLRDWLSTFPGGMMFYLGCHLVDLILQIQGEPERIIPMNKQTGHLGTSSEDFGFALFEYKNGVSFAKTSAVEPGGFARRQLVVTGTKGSVELKPFEMICEKTEAVQTQYTEKTEFLTIPKTWMDMGHKERSPLFDRYCPMMEGFASMVRGEKINPITPDYELTLYKTLLKACGGSAKCKSGLV